MALKRTASKRITDLDERVRKLELNLEALHSLTRDHLGKALDKKYEFGEILECLDDIMHYIDSHP
jgi:hypothetical protein